MIECICIRAVAIKYTATPSAGIVMYKTFLNVLLFCSVLVMELNMITLVLFVLLYLSKIAYKQKINTDNLYKKHDKFYRSNGRQSCRIKDCKRHSTKGCKDPKDQKN